MGGCTLHIAPPKWMNEWMTAALCIICNVNNYFVQSAAVVPRLQQHHHQPGSSRCFYYAPLVSSRFWCNCRMRRVCRWAAGCRLGGWARECFQNEINIKPCVLFVINKWQKIVYHRRRRLQFNDSVTLTSTRINPLWALVVSLFFVLVLGRGRAAADDNQNSSDLSVWFNFSLIFLEINILQTLVVTASGDYYQN